MIIPWAVYQIKVNLVIVKALIICNSTYFLSARFC